MTSTAPIPGPVHIANGTRYGGRYEQATPLTAEVAEERSIRLGKCDPADYVLVVAANGAYNTAHVDDVFASEEEARAACRARRKPRQPKTVQPLYGDFAQLAAFVGVRTDGTGRRAR